MNNSTFLNSTTTPSFKPNYFPYGVQILITSLYTIVAVVTISLNAFICYLFFKNEVKKTSFNLLLMALSITDLLTAILLTPYMYIDQSKFEASQVTMDRVCALTGGLATYYICTTVTMFILTFISVNRYVAVNHPTRALWLRKPKTVWILFAASWIVTTSINIPNFFSFRFDKATRLCFRQWPGKMDGDAYTYCTVFLGAFFPVIVMLYTLIATIKTLWWTKRDTGGQSAIMKIRRKVVIVLLILTGTYFILITPMGFFWILALTTDVFPKSIDGMYQVMKVTQIVVLIGFLNPMLDPIIYAFSAPEIKEAFRRRFCRTKRPEALTEFKSDTRVTTVDQPAPNLI